MARRTGGGGPRIEGVRPLIEALRAGRRRVHRVWLPRSDSSPGLRELQELLEAGSIPLVRDAGPVPGVVGECDPYPEGPPEALLEGGGPHFWVALDRVTDVGNLGAIARTSEVAGVTALILEHHHAPPIGPGALRASAGALEHLQVGRTPNLGRTLDLARAEGLRILAADMRGEPLAKLPAEELQGDLVWVFGSEDRGLRTSILERADRRVSIEVAGRVDSLGVSAAAAFLLLATAERRLERSP